MIGKFIAFAEIIILIVYSLFSYVYNYIFETIYRIPSNEKAPQEEEEEQEEEEQEEEATIESFQNNISPEQTAVETKTTMNIYRPTDYYAGNINEYNEYSISPNIPQSITFPKNYAFQTQEFEKENTEYNYVDFNNIDGSGVHLHSNWEQNGVNRPWFETCLSPLNCQTVEGSLEKFDYSRN